MSLFSESPKRKYSFKKVGGPEPEDGRWKMKGVGLSRSGKLKN
jgi:hypothetical protein